MKLYKRKMAACVKSVIFKIVQSLKNRPKQATKKILSTFKCQFKCHFIQGGSFNKMHISRDGTDFRKKNKHCFV